MIEAPVATWFALAVALVGARGLLGVLVSQGYRRIRNHLDARWPDDLPRTAAEWLIEALAARGLTDAVQVAVTDAGGIGDAYWPNRQWIQLRRRTAYKRDPGFWAIAAHELGHALTLRRAPVLGVLFPAFRLGGMLAGLASVLLLANLFLVSTDVTALAYGALVVGLALSAGVLVDEALASRTALGLLAADERLQPGHLRAARLHLGAAFATYVAGFAGSLVLLVAWDVVSGLLATLEPPAPLAAPSWTWWVALVLGVRGVIGVGVVLAGKRTGVQLFPLGLLVALLWGVWRVPELAVPVAVACVAGSGVLAQVVLVLGAVCALVLAVPVLAVVAQVYERRVELPPEGGPSPAERRRLRAQDEARLAELLSAPSGGPSLALRLYLLHEVAYVPLCVAVLLG